MKSSALTAARPARTSFMQKALGATVAGLLAIASLGVSTAHANENPEIAGLMDSAPLELTTNDSAAPELPLVAVDLPLVEASANANDAQRVGKHTMTFNYYEMVHYDDPDWFHPTGLRLLRTHTVEGLNVGDTLNTWDYVEDIDGYFFFDATPANPVVSDDESQNVVDLLYMNPEVNTYTVNYYRVSGHDADANTESSAAVGDATVADIDGVSLRFEHVGGETVDGQYFNKKIVGTDVAPEIDSLLFLDSYPQSIRVQTSHDANVLNLLYADNHVTLPDRIEVPDDEPADEPGAGLSPDDGEADESAPEGTEPGETAPGDTTPAPSDPGAETPAPVVPDAPALGDGSNNGNVIESGTDNAGDTSAAAGNAGTGSGSSDANAEASPAPVTSDSSDDQGTTDAPASDEDPAGYTTTVTIADTGTPTAAVAELAQTSDATPWTAPIALIGAVAAAAATLAYRRSRS